jgi:hypothetical protein
MPLVVVQVVLDCDVEEKPDVAVGYAIADFAAPACGADQTGQAELAQLMTRGRLCRTHQLCDVTDPQLTGLEKPVDDAETTRIGEQSETGGESVCVVSCQCLGKPICVRCHMAIIYERLFICTGGNTMAVLRVRTDFDDGDHTTDGITDVK